jgi:formyl transferase-like protein
MSTVLLCRDGLSARYVAHRLADAGRLDAIVLETGADARRRKLRRELRRTPWWRMPMLALDLTALALYGRWTGRAFRRRLAGHAALGHYPERVPLRRFADANDVACVSALRELAPDVLVVLGTSILKPDVLEIPGGAALNIHGGIVPQYRNVHSEVWAVLKGDTENVGTTIIHLDSGIDSGAIALQRRVEGAEGFFDLRWKNLELAGDLIVEALELEVRGVLPRHAQDAPGGFYRTPGAAELIRLGVTGMGR